MTTNADAARRRPWWLDAALVPAIAALAGAAIGVGGTFKITEMTLQAERDRETRELRRPIYTGYLAAVRAYAGGVNAVAACDAQGVPRAACATTSDDMETLAFDVNVATIDMYSVGSGRALAAMDAMDKALPHATVGAAGQPLLVDNDDAAYNDAFAVFVAVTACDTSLAPPRDC